MSLVRETIAVDTRELEFEVIPALLAYGRRTMQEQCVTSATFIACRWSDAMPFVEIATIDSDLEEVVSPAKGRKPAITMGQMVVMERANPNSKYSKLTGNRWPVVFGYKPSDFSIPADYRHGGFRENAFALWLEAVVDPIVERMKSSRHSSTHFLQSGIKPIIRQGLESPYYKYNPQFGTRRELRAQDNPLNTLDSNQLGGMTIDLMGDDCLVTSSNDAGEPEGGSNDVLAAKHRRALIEYGTPPLEAAIAQEVSDGRAELDRRMELGWKIKYPQWV